ncbi:hypothetical protein FA15DRAFT_711062 [Coprinopsis marcescibilis]|uniref:Uncharacterized protein n=1 Tax=Coprinopsis marcescibilis TaxID=230819 RepID=A0A5C3KAQ4_COPMA|nr:hypothetical protein FA15DRAFT_711062 [Coprinopsis marcescibilis]
MNIAETARSFLMGKRVTTDDSFEGLPLHNPQPNTARAPTSSIRFRPYPDTSSKQTLEVPMLIQSRRPGSPSGRPRSAHLTRKSRPDSLSQPRSAHSTRKTTVGHPLAPPSNTTVDHPLAPPSNTTVAIPKPAEHFQAHVDGSSSSSNKPHWTSKQVTPVQGQSRGNESQVPSTQGQRRRSRSPAAGTSKEGVQVITKVRVMETDGHKQLEQLKELNNTVMEKEAVARNLEIELRKATTAAKAAEHRAEEAMRGNTATLRAYMEAIKEQMEEDWAVREKALIAEAQAYVKAQVQAGAVAAASEAGTPSSVGPNAALQASNQVVAAASEAGTPLPVGPDAAQPLNQSEGGSLRGGTSNDIPVYPPQNSSTNANNGAGGDKVANPPQGDPEDMGNGGNSKDKAPSSTPFVRRNAYVTNRRMGQNGIEKLLKTNAERVLKNAFLTLDDDPMDGDDEEEASRSIFIMVLMLTDKMQLRRMPRVPKPTTFRSSRGGAGPRFTFVPQEGQDAPPSSASASPPQRASMEGLRSQGSPEQETISTSGDIMKVLQRLAEGLEGLTEKVNGGKVLVTKTPKRRRIGRTFVHESPKEKPEGRKELMSVIRPLFNALLGIEQDMDIVCSPAVKEDKQAVEDFQQGQRGPPLLNPLQPSWSRIGEKKCLWNISLRQQFAEFIIKVTEYTEADRAEIKDIYHEKITRLVRYMGKAANKEGENDEGRDERLMAEASVARKKARVVARRHTIFGKRKEITEEERDDAQDEVVWRDFHKVVSVLGYNGMSSDESDYDNDGNPTGKAFVRHMDWRAPAIGTILKHIDQDEKMTGAYGGPKAGNCGLKRKRKMDARPTRRPAKAGLPINFYHPTWYSTLSKELKRELDVKPEMPLPEYRPVNDVDAMG